MLAAGGQASQPGVRRGDRAIIQQPDAVPSLHLAGQGASLRHTPAHATYCQSVSEVCLTRNNPSNAKNKLAAALAHAFANAGRACSPDCCPLTIGVKRGQQQGQQQGAHPAQGAQHCIVPYSGTDDLQGNLGLTMAILASFVHSGLTEPPAL